MTKELLWICEADEQAIDQVALLIGLYLKQSDPFTVWLKGELGAGKTTLTRHILRALGLAANVPVLSPTYTYVNEYELAGKRYAHCDFYRLHDQQLQAEDDLLEHAYAGTFIEWPTSKTAPNYMIEIENLANSRRYTFFKCG